jgi:TatA/E family protein of Tat protein translocase
MYNMPLLFFDVSGGELLIVLLAVFVLFGPKRIPEIARALAKGIQELKNTTNDIQTGLLDKDDEEKQHIGEDQNKKE